MGILRGLFEHFSRDAPDEHTPLTYDMEGRALYNEDIVDMVLEKLERRREERMDLELQWQLNANFLYGNQFCEIDMNSHTVQEYDAPYEWMQHEVFNNVEPLFRTRGANLGKISYIMTVNPRTSEQDDIDKAKVSTELLRYKQKTSGFDQFVDTAINWCETTGTSFVWCWWDQSKGDKVADVETEVKDPETGAFIRKNDRIYSGDLEYGLLSSYEVFPESIYKQYVKDQRSIIVEQVMSVEDIFDQYGIVCQGEDVETYSMSPVEGAGGFGYISTVQKMVKRSVENAQKVITYMERPGRMYPEGRLIIVIGDELVHYGKLPYTSLPIVAIKSSEVSGQFFGRSFIQSLIPLQRAYNGLMNQFHDYSKRASIGTWLVEEGSVRDIDEFADVASEPGGIIEYRKDRNAPSQPNIQPFPSQMLEQIQQLRTDMEYVAGVSQLMVYGQRNGVTSGTAIENLTEIDNTRLSLTGESIRHAILDLAKIWLEVYKKYAVGYRVLRIVGSNDAGSVLTWTSEDINSYDIEFNAENELIYSAESQKQNAMMAFEMGLYNENSPVPENVRTKLLEAMRVNDYSVIDENADLQKKRADRENSFFRSGIPPVMQKYDNHAIHIAQHEKMMLQLDYEGFKARSPDLARQFEEHVNLHRMAMEEEITAARNAAIANNGGQING